MDLRQYLRELKRRNIFKVAAVYIVAGWIIIQVTTTVFPIFNFPNWSSQFVIILVFIGFPLAMVFAWAFEVTPEGVKRTGQVLREYSITKQTGEKAATQGTFSNIAGTLQLEVP